MTFSDSIACSTRIGIKITQVSVMLTIFLASPHRLQMLVLHLQGTVATFDRQGGQKQSCSHQFFQDSANKNSNQFIFDWIIQEIMRRRF